MNIIRSLWGRRLLLLALLVALIALFAAPPARAAEIRGGEDVILGRGEVVEGDLYVAANSVTIDGTIKGDLVAVAGQITVNGTVEGDLLVAGQGIVINGVVRDDARAAGQAILLGPSARVTAIPCRPVDRTPGTAHENPGLPVTSADSKRARSRQSRLRMMNPPNRRRCFRLYVRSRRRLRAPSEARRELAGRPGRLDVGRGDAETRVGLPPG